LFTANRSLAAAFTAFNSRKAVLPERSKFYRYLAPARHPASSRSGLRIGPL